jgi:thymidine kinase
MSFTLILGPMFSGKSTELKRRVDRLSIALKFQNINPKSQILYIRPSIDNRYGPRVITHSGISDDQILYLDDLSKVDPELATIRYIFIDELQFYKNVLANVLRFLKKGVVVVGAGLDAFANQTLWPEIGPLIPFATELIKINSVCMNCGAGCATLTVSVEKITSMQNLNDPSGQIKVGSSNIYKSICLACFLK